MLRKGICKITFERLIISEYKGPGASGDYAEVWLAWAVVVDVISLLKCDPCIREMHRIECEELGEAFSLLEGMHFP